ncbi:MAG: YbgC/FadM family acyl-CoA thioesterase [Oligoflexia bacterium]|nr:YbgC/FadM family acyl-CoA thioesterase [Oligoflexia bacterium]
MKPFVHIVQVYYEDTDHSGVVYHSNYFKYFERAREHLLGVDTLVRLWREEGIGFVVYRASAKYREGAVFGDRLEIRPTVARASDYRALFTQDVWRPGGQKALVEGQIELCCVNRDRQLVRLPKLVWARVLD